MKSFQNKNAMTLVELIIGVSISAAIIIIVSFFITSSVEDLADSSVMTESIDKGFLFRDTLDRSIRGWYGVFTLYWTWSRSIILLENNDRTDWIIYWIVDWSTKKLETEYLYWDKFIWYRKISWIELGDIQTNSWVIYDYSFFIDKIYKGMRIKDFQANLYNNWSILDLNMSIVMIKDENNFWLNFNDFILDQWSIFQYNLNF